MEIIFFCSIIPLFQYSIIPLAFFVPLIHQQNPHIHHIGAGRARDQEIAQFLEKVVRVVILKKFDRIHAHLPCPGDRRMVSQSSGRIGWAVRSVRPSTQKDHLFQSADLKSP